MSDLGHFLSEKRKEQDKSIKDVSKATLISKAAIEAIESGDFDSLPSYVHCYGFVKKYAEYLGYTYDDVKSLFESECKKEDFQVQEAQESEEDYSSADSKRKFPVFAAVFLLLIIGGILAYIFVPSDSTHKEIRLTEGNAGLVTDNRASENNTDLNESKAFPDDNISSEKIAGEKEQTPKTDNQSSITENATESDGKAKDNEITPYEITQELNKEKKVVEKKYNVSLDFSDTCWVHVNIDNEKQLDFIAEGGLTKTISFSDFFIIDIGNAAAITISHNGDIYRNLGGWREPVKNLRFTMDNGTLKYSKIEN
ncbi:RodZ domain-containing protein [Flexistipes sp.]|uniref:RodZ domain-containing protein n=1 Tax=Flexistipes sp. TaxID=3088135 RepID=UPI002E1BABB7|nr:RodZ domain-containing protein [Flexistipes sp.]